MPEYKGRCETEDCDNRVVGKRKICEQCQKKRNRDRARAHYYTKLGRTIPPSSKPCATEGCDNIIANRKTYCPQCLAFRKKEHHERRRRYHREYYHSHKVQFRDYRRQRYARFHKPKPAPVTLCRPAISYGELQRSPVNRLVDKLDKILKREATMTRVT